MSLEIEIQCSKDNGIAFACSRVILEMCLFIGIIIFIAWGIYKVKTHMHRYSFELLPLSSTLI
jgi:flagellar biogenesis protein FliO